MNLLEALRWGLALLLVSLAVAAFASWRRHRSAPSAYVAGAFGSLGLVTLAGRLSDVFVETRPELVADVSVATLLAFPWLLAAFAWSFTGRMPTWLRVAGVVTAAVALTAFVLPPLDGDDTSGALVGGYIAVVLVLWGALTGAAAIHLWRAGRGQRVVRARTRLLALGALVLAAALLLAGTVGRGEARGLATAIVVLAVVAALLFAAGFAPPRPLRLYWRQLPSRRMHEMQTRLVAALTPQDVAAAVTPVVADTFGGGALCTDPSGQVVARSGLSDADADAIHDLVRDGGDGGRDVQLLESEGWHLAVQTSPYAPLFGEDERDLLDRFGLQLRLALQRAELFVAHERARRQLEAAGRDLQAMLVGLAHDLRSPAVTISTYAALLDEARDDADRAQMIEGLRDGSAYLDRLVDGLTSLSRIGRNDGEREPVALSEVVSGVARRLAAAYPDLRVEHTPDLPVVCIDRLRIEQVVDNLLGNAAKHGGREDLTVEVHWAAGEGGGLLTVADDGRGVPDDERESVFALFRRGTTSANGSGVGLGLVRRVIESEGGSVRFAPSDRGARIEVHLPDSLLVSDAGQPPAAAAHDREVSHRTR